MIWSSSQSLPSNQSKSTVLQLGGIHTVNVNRNECAQGCGTFLFWDSWASILRLKRSEAEWSLDTSSLRSEIWFCIPAFSCLIRLRCSESTLGGDKSKVHTFLKNKNKNLMWFSRTLMSRMSVIHTYFLVRIFRSCTSICNIYTHTHTRICRIENNIACNAGTEWTCVCVFSHLVCVLLLFSILFQ